MTDTDTKLETDGGNGPRYGDREAAPPNRTTLILTITGVIVILSLVALLIAESIRPGQVVVGDRAIYILLALIAALLGFDQLAASLPVTGQNSYYRQTNTNDDRRIVLADPSRIRDNNRDDDDHDSDTKSRDTPNDEY